jgi:pimeloyl-ACP methyl ester carboxylesterase
MCAMQPSWLKSLLAGGLGAVIAVIAGFVAPDAAAAAELRPGLTPCRLEGVEHAAWCASVRRPLDPQRPQGPGIDVHYAVLPALARNRKPDPVFFLAGGPGQSAIDLAGPIARMLARLSNRRDIVLIDQRGTGRSAPLPCPEGLPTDPLAESAGPDRQAARLVRCRSELSRLPHGDLRHYTTHVAMQDVDAVRQALGAAQVDLVGVSYGTRAALEYLRQFPKAVRRMVIDGVAPADMALPAAFSTDNQAALEGVLKACEDAAACRKAYPALRARWRELLAGLPREVRVAHPVTGASETVVVQRDMLLSLVRAALYVPALASALPLAISQAAAGRYEPLVGLSAATGGGSSGKVYEGMHFAVVCSEDVPRLPMVTDPPGADFGDSSARQYLQICAGWPRAEVPAAFYSIPVAPSATLVLSGGADPVTPPRHGDRVAAALGPKARHVVVPQAGHGVIAIGCMRDVLFRFIDAETDALALQGDAACVRGIPRPPVFVPVAAGAAP